jgi:hypothetical protein
MNKAHPIFENKTFDDVGVVEVGVVEVGVLDFPSAVVLRAIVVGGPVVVVSALAGCTQLGTAPPLRVD